MSKKKVSEKALAKIEQKCHVSQQIIACLRNYLGMSTAYTPFTCACTGTPIHVMDRDFTTKPPNLALLNRNWPS